MLRALLSRSVVAIPRLGDSITRRSANDDDDNEAIVERIWEKFLTDRDREVLTASGYGSHGGFGKKPALLVIDVS